MADAQLRDDHPIMRAWRAYKASVQRASNNGPHGHPEWGAFLMGYIAATERASDLHESVSPASNAERSSGDPGADAMGAIIEYRDLIRRDAENR